MKLLSQRALFLALLSVLPTWGVGCARAAQAAPPVHNDVTILVTHPRASVLHFYDTLVREHVLNVPNLHLVGIYHSTETEDYRDAVAYIEREKITWITLRSIKCPINAATMYEAGTCRDEFADLVDHSSGIIFNGGPDIPPVLYGRPTLLTTIIEAPHRHIFELSLLFHLVGGTQNPSLAPLLRSRPDYAILGICVGMQTMNVADGGTLIQDIPSEVYGLHTLEDVRKSDPNTWHRSLYHELDPSPDVATGVFHPVRITPAAPREVRDALGNPDLTPQVLSIHHQAVGRVGSDYVVTATSLDGKVVEGIHHKTFQHVWGWQFHPERSFLWDAKEVQRIMEGDAEQNFGYDTLHRDNRSREFNLSIWHLFNRDIEASSQHQLQAHP